MTSSAAIVARIDQALVRVGDHQLHAAQAAADLTVIVQLCGVQDRDGAKPVLRGSRAPWPFVRTVFADGGYAGRLVDWARAEANPALAIVKRPRGLHRFEPLPRRWVIERSFAWLIKNRRLVRDFERRLGVAVTLIFIAATVTLLRRIR